MYIYMAELFPSSPEMITTFFVNWLYPNRNLKKNQIIYYLCIKAYLKASLKDLVELHLLGKI